MPSKRRASSEDITIDSAPTSINPYTVLSLPKEATADQIKTAYRKAALKSHPDKAPPAEKEAAHTKFQEIAFAYAILSDERRRRRYDATGRTEESLELDDNDEFDWQTFYREQFADVVTSEAIEKFEREYKGGEEERGHVLAAYEGCEGNMNGVYARVMLSDVLVDEERFRGIIDAAIESGEVEAFRRYTHETEKSRKGRIARARKEREREAEEAEEALEEEDAEEAEAGGKAKKAKSKEKSNGGMGDLAALIQQRQQGRAENFFDSLEEKYAPKGKKGSKRAMDEPPEEAFAKNRGAGNSKKTKK